MKRRKKKKKWNASQLDQLLTFSLGVLSACLP